MIVPRTVTKPYTASSNPKISFFIHLPHFKQVIEVFFSEDGYFESRSEE